MTVVAAWIRFCEGCEAKLEARCCEHPDEMGYCSSCGEILSAGRCIKCGNTESVNPVTQEEVLEPMGNFTHDGDLAVNLAGMDLDSKEWMGRARAEPEQPRPIAAPPPCVRGETGCGRGSKAITTEALALADGRLVHSTCLLCVRCGIRLYDEYKANGPTRIFCENCGPAAAPTLPAKHVQDTGDILKAAEWYYSDGDSNDGPVTVEKLAKLFKGKTISEATFVWSEVLGDDADWLPLSDKKNEALLALVRGSGGGSGGSAKPAPAAAKAAAAEVPVAADACAACGGKLGVDVIQALDKQWHSKCFVCAGCSLPFDDGMFVAKEGKPYHKACAAKAFGATCAGCGELIDGKHVVVDGQKYHKTCFVCTNCLCIAEGGTPTGPTASRTARRTRAARSGSNTRARRRRPRRRRAPAAWRAPRASPERRRRAATAKPSTCARGRRSTSRAVPAASTG